MCSLVGTATPEPLTVLSEIRNVFAYFSLSENDFIAFKKRVAGTSMAEKISHLPPVELVLSDGSTYPEKGTVQLVSCQFDSRTGTIPLRAVFPHADATLPSGHTGQIHVSHVSPTLI